MKAAVVHEFGKPLRIEEVPIPTPGPGEVLIRVMANGVCHTDLHAAEGDWPAKPRLPFIPGHEGAGVIAAVGPGVTHLKEGNPAGVAWAARCLRVVRVLPDPLGLPLPRSAQQRLLGQWQLRRVCDSPYAFVRKASFHRGTCESLLRAGGSATRHRFRSRTKHDKKKTLRLESTRRSANQHD